MHVIDFLRSTVQVEKNGHILNAIELPTYHRGHLGLLPDTHVHLGIHGEGHGFEKGCELIISAYPSVTANLAELTCTMADHLGVVNKLFKALRSLGVNILVAETYSLKHNKQHHMEMIFDWSSSLLTKQIEVPIAFRSTTRRLSSIIPTNDFRYLRLLARILQCCSNELLWEPHESGLALPSLKLRSFEARSTFAEVGHSEVRKIDLPTSSADETSARDTTDLHAESTKTTMTIGLSAIEEELRRIIREPSDNPDSPSELPYLMLSDTATRSLRVWFPQNSRQARQILHVGFRHSDIAGALEVLTMILKFSNFNILTSLLRRGKGSPRQNVWEVHLQYEGEDPGLMDIVEIQDRSSRTEKAIQWLCDHVKLEDVVAKWSKTVDSEDLRVEDLRSDLESFCVWVRAPEYPRTDEVKEQPFMWSDDSGNKARLDWKAESKAPILAERRHWTLKALEDDAAEYNGGIEDDTERGGLVGADRLWAQALAISDGIPVPRLFLSYPATAKEHAERVKRAIELKINQGETRLPRLIVDEFQEQNLAPITGTVLACIRRADFFLGIWHSEKKSADRVSPWMPFEYGVASALGKPTAVVVRNTIPERVWRRIDPHIAHPLYDDLSFQEKTVSIIIRHIKDVWLTQLPQKEREAEVGALWPSEVPTYR